MPIVLRAIALLTAPFLSVTSGDIGMLNQATQWRDPRNNPSTASGAGIFRDPGIAAPGSIYSDAQKAYG